MGKFRFPSLSTTSSRGSGSTRRRSRTVHFSLRKENVPPHQLGSEKGKNVKSKRLQSRTQEATPHETDVEDVTSEDEILRKKRGLPTHVFVGNVNSITTKDGLQKHFAGCGGIKSVSIRYGFHVEETPGIGRHYAVIDFERTTAYRRALRLNKSTLDGCPLVVCLSPIDLPEAGRIHENVIRKRDLDGYKRRFNVRALCRNATKVDDEHASSAPAGVAKRSIQHPDRIESKSRAICKSQG